MTGGHGPRLEKEGEKNIDAPADRWEWLLTPHIIHCAVQISVEDQLQIARLNLLNNCCCCFLELPQKFLNLPQKYERFNTAGSMDSVQVK